LKDSPVTLVYGDYQVRVIKHGLVGINTESSELKVFKGEAEVTTADNRAIVKEGRLMPFAAGLVAEKLDAKTGDDLYLWTRDRSESLSAANMASARTISSGFAGSGSGSWNGGWYYNPYMSMFTYVPSSGMIASPFGFGFFSPMAIYSAYSPVYSFYGGGAPRGAPSLSGLSSAARSGSTSGLASGTAPQLGSSMRSGGSAPTDFGSGARAGIGMGGGAARVGGGARAGR
jgi:hypothetical protein